MGGDCKDSQSQGPSKEAEGTALVRKMSRKQRPLGTTPNWGRCGELINSHCSALGSKLLHKRQGSRGDRCADHSSYLKTPKGCGTPINEHEP